MKDKEFEMQENVVLPERSQIAELIATHHAMMQEKGFWDEDRHKSTHLMNVVGEVAEANEALRLGREMDIGELHQMQLSDNIDDTWFEPTFDAHMKETFEEEMADIILRVFDICGAYDIPIEDLIRWKMRKNSLRGKMHGKKY